MTGIILAAGEGSRMNNPDGPPKVLMEVWGQTLLEHTLSTLASLGISRCIIVVGYRGEEIEQFILRKGLHRRMDLRVVYNDRWREGNASSILAARPHLTDDRFVVVMGDHLFDPQGLQGFLKVRGDFVGVFCALRGERKTAKNAKNAKNTKEKPLRPLRPSRSSRPSR